MAIPETMKAALLVGKRELRIQEIPVPTAGRGEILVKVRAVSICPSDWRLYSDGHAGDVVPVRPMSQGHEFSGDIAAIGPGVASFEVGQPVAVDPTWFCGKCDMCLSDRTHLCRNVVFPSFPPFDGALREYIACPADRAKALPDGVDYTFGAMVEPLGVAMHGVKHGNPQPDDKVVVLGAGIIGISTLFLALAKGVKRVAVVEPVAARRDWPARIGADVVVSSANELRDYGFEADVVFECSGGDRALDDAIHLAAPSGRIVVVGIPHLDQVSFDINVARRRELAVVFSRRSNNTLLDALQLVANRTVDFRSLPLKRFTLEQTAEALETTGHPGEALRAIVVM